jgi:hypothetical protein
MSHRVETLQSGGALEFWCGLAVIRSVVEHKELVLRHVASMDEDGTEGCIRRVGKFQVEHVGGDLHYFHRGSDGGRLKNQAQGMDGASRTVNSVTGVARGIVPSEHVGWDGGHGAPHWWCAKPG